MARPHLATPRDVDRLAARASRTVASARQREAQTQRLADLLRQLQQLERRLVDIVSRPSLTPAVRAELFGLLTGIRPGRQSAVNTSAEQQLVDRYRALSDSGKRLVSVLVKELAGRRLRPGRRRARS